MIKTRLSPYHAQIQAGGMNPETTTTSQPKAMQAVPGVWKIPRKPVGGGAAPQQNLPLAKHRGQCERPSEAEAKQMVWQSLWGSGKQDLRLPKDRRGCERSADAEAKQMVWQSLWGGGKREWTAPYPMDNADARYFRDEGPSAQSPGQVPSRQPGLQQHAQTPLEGSTPQHPPLQAHGFSQSRTTWQPVIPVNKAPVELPANLQDPTVPSSGDRGRVDAGHPQSKPPVPAKLK